MKRKMEEEGEGWWQKIIHFFSSKKAKTELTKEEAEKILAKQYQITDINQPDQNGDVPLDILLKEIEQHGPTPERLKKLEIFLIAGAFEGGWGGTFLHQAVSSGKVNVVKIILATPVGERVINKKDALEKTPLHLAISDIDIVDELLKAKGILVDACDLMGKAPLHYAVAEQKLKVVNALIKAGADVNIQAFMKPEIMQELMNKAEKIKNDDEKEREKERIKAEEGNAPLHYSIRGDTAEVTNALLNAPNIQTNLQNSKGNTALHLAAAYPHPAHVHALLRKKANCCKINKEGLTPIEYGMRKDVASDSVKALIAFGTCPEDVIREGMKQTAAKIKDKIKKRDWKINPLKYNLKEIDAKLATLMESCGLDDAMEEDNENNADEENNTAAKDKEEAKEKEWQLIEEAREELERARSLLDTESVFRQLALNHFRSSPTSSPRRLSKEILAAFKLLYHTSSFSSESIKHCKYKTNSLENLAEDANASQEDIGLIEKNNPKRRTTI